MKILLTGKNGQVGFELRRSLAVVGEVIAIGSDVCDFRDPAAVRSLVRDAAPDAIVNPAAYTAVDNAEGDRAAAWAINADAPGVLAEEAQRSGAVMVHFSTDYVFDGGKSGSYTEDDLPNPQNVYGETKLAGERAVLGACNRSFVLRTSWVVGAHGNNFAKTMLRLAAERDSLGVVADQIGAPTSAALLADWTAHLLHRALRGPSDPPFGVYHAVASGATSWHAYACHVIERAREAGAPVRLRREGIRAITTADFPVAAKRPLNSRLDNSRLQAVFGLRAPPWQDGVDHVLDEVLPMRAKK